MDNTVEGFDKTALSMYGCQLIEAGRNTPALLLEAIQSDLHEKIRDWLEVNAPEEVFRAVDASDCLRLMIEKIKTNQLTDIDAGELPGVIAEACNLAIQFGGTFLDGWVLPDATIPGRKAE